MARAGVTKFDIQRARLVLIKAGRHPSIDAIRIELGNTGSKATIFRHLKEIEADEGGTGVPQETVSDELLASVTSLAGRLEFEAQERFDTLRAGHAEEQRRLTEQLEKARAESNAARSEAERSQVELSAERVARQRAEAELAALRLEYGQVSSQLTAQLEGAQEQLRATNAQVASLEEKHTHVREALEHFRNASREQRDREARQHEQQLQYLQRESAGAAEALTAKQVELRSALKEKTGALELLSAARAERRQVDEQLRELKHAAERLAVQNQLVEDMRGQAQQAVQQYETLRLRASDLQQRNGELELFLASVTATAQSQGEMVKELLARIGQPAPQGKAKAKSVTAG